MAGGMALLENGAPGFTGGESTEKKVEALQGYIFTLVEQLRYILRNLDAGNMNQAALDSFVKTITEPINIRIKDGEDKLTQITITAGGLVSRVEDAEKGLSAVEQTVEGLTVTVIQEGNGIRYELSSGGMVISSTRNIEYYSLDGRMPPVGKLGGVVVNAAGAPALSNGWYDQWNEGWTGLAVYCCCSYDDGEHWGAVTLKQGTAGRDAYTVLLNNNPYVFAGDVETAKAGQARVGVLAFRGETRTAATIGEITGQVEGLTTRVMNSGTENAYFLVDVTTALTAQNGTLEVPVTVDGMEFRMLWSWSVAYKGERGQRGSSANVDFEAVNEALGELFKTWSGGTPTTVTDAYIYAPQVKGGEFYGAHFYAGAGNGFASMDETGFNLQTEEGYKAGIGYWRADQFEHPYMILGVGTGSDAAGAAIVQKLAAGLWIGDGCIVAAGGYYPGNKSSAVSIASEYPNATGLFIDFDGDEVYKYTNGVPTKLTGGGSGGGGSVYLTYG